MRIRVIQYYKDWKCAVNENPSLRIESAGSKTSNNGPLKNGSAVSTARLYVGSKIIWSYESDHAFKTIFFFFPHPFLIVFKTIYISVQKSHK